MLFRKKRPKMSFVESYHPMRLFDKRQRQTIFFSNFRMEDTELLIFVTTVERNQSYSYNMLHFLFLLIYHTYIKLVNSCSLTDSYFIRYDRQQQLINPHVKKKH
jgi:hypothetical protein